jgi:D-3-phosphoglycerate dehydrogenase
MPHTVLIPEIIREEGKTYLKERGYEVRMGSALTVEAIMKDVIGCSAILLRTASMPAKVMESEKKLKVIARHGVGVDNIDLDAATKLGIWVTNAPESNAISVAEHTIGLIISCAKYLMKTSIEFRGGNFEVRNQVTGIDLEGKVLGLVGVGRIGRRVAKKAALGLDMKVMGYDPYLKSEDVPGEVQKVDDLALLLKSSDFVSLHMPSTAETKAFFGKNELAMMKDSAFLINAARGDIVNEKELIAGLKEGLIAGAGLDVFEQEPPEKDLELLSMENVTVTPHSAAMTVESKIRMAVHAAQGIDEVLTGKKPTWPVNNPVGA